jgi:hypothetical protein
MNGSLHKVGVLSKHILLFDSISNSTYLSCRFFCKRNIFETGAAERPESK